MRGEDLTTSSFEVASLTGELAIAVKVTNNETRVCFRTHDVSHVRQFDYPFLRSDLFIKYDRSKAGKWSRHN